MARPLTVGTRELRNRLSHFLRAVRRGSSVIVTDRGVPVAELRPLGRGRESSDFDAALFADLAARGLVTLPEHRLSDFTPLELPGPPLSDAIANDRDDRV